ncbi:MAG TPA: pyridoxamine 5'-phosphate oxidase [Solirubrobacteraceae bacterium]|nr:pyridoxamine 5'-phosphate oxidase [Solirubrobacteraceae bacterium]
MADESDYGKPLREQDVDSDPLRQFAAWYAQAQAADIRMPEAMAVATASADGAPSLRMVLMRGFDERGFVFFTNYASRKGSELAANRRAALLFHWDALGRQVRIAGAVERTSAEETAAYVRSRPRGSQLSALASPQSEVVADREELERCVAELAERYGDGELPIPGGWGGFRVAVEEIEFWQQRHDRLHDRLRYRATPDDGWKIERLGP